jgi:hypothetical protein
MLMNVKRLPLCSSDVKCPSNDPTLPTSYGKTKPRQAKKSAC